MNSSSMARVLIVDDEPRILSALRRCLRREDFEIETVEGPLAARDALAERDFALILSDYKMPGESGTDLLAFAAETYPETQRILMSGWTGEIAEEARERAKPFAVLSKPWDEALLRDTLRKALDS